MLIVNPWLEADSGWGRRVEKEELVKVAGCSLKSICRLNFSSGHLDITNYDDNDHISEQI